MGKSITEQIQDLETENQKLRDHKIESEKIFDKALKLELGISKKQIEKIINSGFHTSEFEKKICEYFSIKSEEEKNQFIKVFCSESSLNYFKNKREKDSFLDAEEWG